MSKESSKNPTSEINPRTARAVAAILSQSGTGELFTELNRSEGRNQAEQAGYLGTKSPFLRDIYERGGTVSDGILTVPKENLTLPPAIQIASLETAVEKLTRLTNDLSRAQELAPQLIEMGERISGKHSDGETRLKVFNWLYNSLEGKQELLPEMLAPELETANQSQTERQFSEKWQQIVDLSESLAALEPQDKLQENSLEEMSERETGNIFAANEISGEIEEQNSRRGPTEELIGGGSLVGFERIKLATDLPQIPANLFPADFEKLLEKTADIDLQLEQGVPKHEILAPFKGYVELTRLDNEMRQVEEEYLRVQVKQQTGSLKESPPERLLVVTREELRELAEDKLLLRQLEKQQGQISETLQSRFGDEIDRQKVEDSINNQNISAKNSRDKLIELTEEKTELQKFLIGEKNLSREIENLSESITNREKNFRPFQEIGSGEITPERQKELNQKVLSLELPLPGLLKEKYPELSPAERIGKINEANNFVINDPAEYFFVRRAAKQQFLSLREREIKNEYRKSTELNDSLLENPKEARKIVSERKEKLEMLRSLEPVFTYRLENSSRIIQAQPSLRAVEGFKFASEYVNYQLKQPETRLRRSSLLYRRYAERLEAAKTSPEVITEAYKIRQENHQSAKIWKESSSEERRGLQRPLSKNEMTLLFLEQPPKSYTAEMSVIKYNFAHYSAAKERMTESLEAGTLEPSPEARKLADSLKTRLNRHDLPTRQKATRHFFESLKIANDQLIIKNDFDHQAAYQTLPPHEKDWIYRSALSQKENLAYKIAFEREMRESKAPATPSTSEANETAAEIREEFSAGTLWHQASILSSGKKAGEHDPVSIEEKNLQSIGYLIHNQNQNNNLRIAGWLETQNSEEMKTAGEILKTFAQTNREIKNDQLNLTVKITESKNVSLERYARLFDRYFPPEIEKQLEFRAGQNEKFKTEQARRQGQAELLNSWRQESETAVYRTDAPINVFANEKLIGEEIGKINALQTQCRRANEVKNAVRSAVEARTKQALTWQSKKFSETDLQKAVNFALSAEGTLPGSAKAVFQIVRDQIKLAEFERFKNSSKELENGIAQIEQSFVRISGLRQENSPYLFRSETTDQQVESLQRSYENKQKQAEAQLITKAAREKFLSEKIEDTEESLTVSQFLFADQLEKAKIESHRQARISLEPEELNQPVKDAALERKFLEYADALETAHQAKLDNRSEAEIISGFTAAQKKREDLNDALQPAESINSPETSPVSLKIYEQHLERQEKMIAEAKITGWLENGKISPTDLADKEPGEIFSSEELQEIRLEAAERTRENLEPKELWLKRQNVSEKLQQTALQTSEALERAHQIYHDPHKTQADRLKAFSELDGDIIKLKNERQSERTAVRFNNFKTDFKRDLVQMYGNTQEIKEKQLLSAMTKGLLLNALEKHEIPVEQIGLSSEKLTEISRSVVLAMTGENKRERTGHQQNIHPENRQESLISNAANQIPQKVRQFEHHR